MRPRNLNSDAPRVEVQAREKEELIQALVNAIDSSADAMIIYDLEGSVKYVGESFTRMFGWTQAEIIGKRIPFVPGPEREKSMKQIRRLIEDGKPVSGFETIRNTKDGKVLNISLSSSRYNDHNGNPAGILVIMRDITGSKLAESRLRKSEEEYRKLYQQSKKAEELYQSLINSSADAIVIYDLEGNATYVSEAFTRMFGWTNAEVAGKRIPFVPGPEREAALEGITKLIRDGVPVSGFETKRNTKDGAVLDVSISSSRYHDHEGNPAGILVILRDITAWKSMERARRRAVNHLAHELTTPLAIVRASTARLAQQDLSGQVKRTVLERIDRNLNRLSDIQTIVQEIIEPRECKPKAFPLVRFTRQILDEIRQESPHRSIDLVSRLVPVKTPFADPIVYEKVLRTLIKNAIENTPDEGRVIVSLRKASSGVILTVSDRGVGISEADRPFLFEAFHHTQATDRYSTKSPYDFDAGGKGLELMQLRILADEGCFDLRFETQRCQYLVGPESSCPGRISSCEHVTDEEGCAKSGGTAFHVFFREPKN